MPPGLVRYHQTGGFHYLTWSCHHSKRFLQAASARDLFENSLEKMRLRYDFVVAGYVLIPTTPTYS